MDKKANLKDEIQIIWRIFATVQECFNFSYYLYKPDTDEEFEYLQRSPDLRFLRHILWRTTVVELSKLFSDSIRRDRYNIIHFINKLKNGHFGEFGINELTISRWENQIEINKDIITKVLTLRDKVYAHTDSDEEKYVNTILTFEETKNLMLIIENIIQNIYSTVFDTYALIDGFIFDKKSFNLIKILAEEYNRKIDEMFGEK